MKILKKYDKQTGASFVFPSSRGFCSCHSIPDHLFPIYNEPSIPTSESADTTPTPATIVPTLTKRDGSLLKRTKGTGRDRVNAKFAYEEHYIGIGKKNNTSSDSRLGEDGSLLKSQEDQRNWQRPSTVHAKFLYEKHYIGIEGLD